MAFLFKCFSIYIYYTMEREGPISYSDCVNYYELLLSIHRTCSFVYIIYASTVHAFHQWKIKGTIENKRNFLLKNGTMKVPSLWAECHD